MMENKVTVKYETLQDRTLSMLTLNIKTKYILDLSISLGFWRNSRFYFENPHFNFIKITLT